MPKSGPRAARPWQTVRSGSLEDAPAYLDAIGEGTALRNVIRPGA